jgi:hypothetical protein
MGDWAQRIESRLRELADEGKDRAGLVKACKVKPSSVSGWFARGAKQTQMIRGDNLIAAAKYLNTSPEWIMTGVGRADSSQPQRLDGATIQSAFDLARRSLELLGMDDFSLEDELDAQLFAQAVKAVAEQGLTSIEDSDVVRFTRELRQSGVVGNGARAGEVGGVGGAASAAQVGGKGKVARRRAG